MVKDNEGFLGFRSYPAPDSPDGLLSEYLGSLAAEDSKKDLMLRAIRPYWMPLALKDAGVEEEKLQLEGYNAVWELMRQAKYICKALHLDPLEAGLSSAVPAGAAVPSVPVASRVPLVAAPPQSEVKQQEEKPQKQPKKEWTKQPYDGMDFDMGLERWPIAPVD